jgi:ABC-2 type transport system permease protein
VIARTLTQAGFEFKVLLRNGEQFLLTIVIPVAVFLGLSATSVVDIGEPRLEQALAGALAVAVLSSAFTSVAIGTGFDRRSGALLLLATTPLSRREVLAARAVSTYAVVGVQVALLAIVAVLRGWRPDGGAAPAVLLLLVGTASLGALGFMLAGLLRAEATLAVANGVFLILLVAGGSALPLDTLPTPLATVVGWLPSAALGDGLRVTLAGVPGSWPLDLLILALWGVAATVVAGRTFRWD